MPHSILAVSLATTLRAGYLLMFCLGVEDLFSNNFAIVRAIHDFVIHPFSPFANMQRKGILRVMPPGL
jgi:hypothetical protein